jgi:hypothetical protein
MNGVAKILRVKLGERVDDGEGPIKGFQGKVRAVRSFVEIAHITPATKISTPPEQKPRELRAN